MGDVTLEIKLQNLEERVEKIEEGGGSGITIDSELSTTSKNPVQNKIITDEINNLNTDLAIQVDSGFLKTKNILALVGHNSHSATDGSVISQASGMSSSTEFVQVESGKNYVISHNGATVNCRWFFYNSNKGFVKTEIGSTFLIPSDVKYIKFQTNEYSGDLNGWQIEEGTTPTPYIQSGGMSNIELTEEVGKATKWVFLGSANIIRNGAYICTLPTDWKECIVKFRDKSVDNYLNASLHVIKEMITDSTANVFRTGFYANASLNAEYVVNITSVVNFMEAYRNGTQITDSTIEASVWYK